MSLSETGTHVGQHLFAMPLTGGTSVVLAQASSMIQAVASGVYVVDPGSPPRKIAAARTAQLQLVGNPLYWIDQTSAGWEIRAAASSK